MADSEIPLDAVLPRPTRAFVTFPTPRELRGDEYRVGVYRYLRAELGIDATKQEAIVQRLNDDPLGTLADLLLALVNQDAILRGQPLPWGREMIGLLTPAQLSDYMPAIIFALYGPAADALTEQARERLLSAGEQRPTPAPTTKPRRRVNRSRTSRPTGRRSATDSPTSTDGPSETSPS